jgi:hypothetical protein
MPDIGMLAYQQAKERENFDQAIIPVVRDDESEIGQLRAENEKLLAELIEYQECGYVALRIERDRYRVTLQTIANEENCPYRANRPGECLELAIREAKQALKGAK